ncbi:UbiA prenyltransferase [Obba rivulosa]|uniref:4-hydroxybenzoate polyprenyltransferase, mitochondrial n=1 Tax=Obba rivulosa TaxID=1052685 RepID=A0A8E2DGN9_9APHY|nr:UbiA prenyltransferase [Obba rivulosa]
MSLDIDCLLDEKHNVAFPAKSNWRGWLELTRLHKSIMGNTLMFWPCVWGLTMAAYAVTYPPHQFVIQTIMFCIGSTLLHSAACVINDICDIEFDRKVERCKTRPLPAGIVSVFSAWVLLLLLVIPAMAMLLLTNTKAASVGLIGVFPLHALYPLMKRWTYWPQAWLGLAMNWGFPVAWIAVTGDIRADIVWVFFLGTICWTIVYDTIYACQDRKDDVEAGVKSTALLFGDWVRPILMAFATVFIVCLVFAGIRNNQGAGYFVISCGGATLHFVWQFVSWNPDIPADGAHKFNSNGATGYIIWAGMLCDYCFKFSTP